MSAPGDATDSSVTVSLGGVPLGTFPVDNTLGVRPYDDYGTANVSVTLPANVPLGATVTLTLAGADTGTSVLVPIRIDKADSTASGTPNKVLAQSKGQGVIQYQGTITAQFGAAVTGVAKIYDGDQAIATANLTAANNGLVKLKLPTLGKGSHPLTLVYEGSTTVKPSTSATVTVVVM
jgi:5'-nucleotidase